MYIHNIRERDVNAVTAKFTLKCWSKSTFQHKELKYSAPWMLTFLNVKWRTANYLMRRHLQSCQAGGEGDEDEDVAVPHGGPTRTDGPLPPMGEQAEPER